MTVIYLIRHGQASFGQANYDQLSKLGEQQAIHLGNSLAKRIEKFDSVCIGTMLRHEQTAERVLAGFDCDLESMNVQYFEGWNEYDHQELLAVLRPEFREPESMMSFIRQQENPKKVMEDSFNAAIRRWMSADYDAEYSETWAQFQARVHDALKQTIVYAKGGQSTLVFTSGGPISLIAQHFLGVPPEQLMKLNWTLLNCGVSKLVVTPSRTILASLNEHTHFESSENKHFLTYT